MKRRKSKKEEAIDEREREREKKKKKKKKIE